VWSMSPMISNGKSGSARIHAVAVLGLVATLTAQVVLSLVIKGASYGETDGEAAQAAILTAFRFAGIFDVSNINPLQGVGLAVCISRSSLGDGYLCRHRVGVLDACLLLDGAFVRPPGIA
jgi:hypothetical protein